MIDLLRRMNGQFMQMYQILGCPLEYRQVVKSIQKTFTEEWSELGSDEIVFAYNKEEGLALQRNMAEQKC